MNRLKPKIIIFDLDNSIFCWLSYFSVGAKKAIEAASIITGIDYKILCEEYKQIIDEEDSIEHPFVIQQLPSILKHYDNNISRILTECSEPARREFNLAAYPYLKPYSGALKTLQKIKHNFPDVKLIVLSDAPLQMGLWRMHKLGVLNYFDAVYGLENPKLPIVKNDILVTQEILLKHLDKWKYSFIGRVRELPNDYRKPNVKGFKNILLDFNIENYSKEDILFIGDNVHKDIKLANEVNITSFLALYGLKINQSSLDTLREFAPARFIHKGIVLEGDYPQPTYRLDQFSDLLTYLE